MADALYRESFDVFGRDFDKAGESATEIKQILQGLGIDSGLIHRAVVIAFEAEMNVVMYADKGTITLLLTDEDIELTIADEGPGIQDIDMALTEGYSTATDKMREMGFGFGMGLPNIRKNADRFDLKTEVGVGTTVATAIGLNHRA